MRPTPIVHTPVKAREHRATGAATLERDTLSPCSTEPSSCFSLKLSVLALHGPNATLIVGGGPVHGRGSIGTKFQSLLASGPEIRLRTVVVIESREGLALLHGEWQVQRSKLAESQLATQGVSAAVIRRQPDGMTPMKSRRVERTSPPRVAVPERPRQSTQREPVCPTSAQPVNGGGLAWPLCRSYR